MKSKSVSGMVVLRDAVLCEARMKSKPVEASRKNINVFIDAAEKLERDTPVSMGNFDAKTFRTVTQVFVSQLGTKHEIELVFDGFYYNVSSKRLRTYKELSTRGQVLDYIYSKVM